MHDFYAEIRVILIGHVWDCCNHEIALPSLKGDMSAEKLGLLDNQLFQLNYLAKIPGRRVQHTEDGAGLSVQAGRPVVDRKGKSCV